MGFLLRLDKAFLEHLFLNRDVSFCSFISQCLTLLIPLFFCHHLMRAQIAHCLLPDFLKLSPCHHKLLCWDIFQSLYILNEPLFHFSQDCVGGKIYLVVSGSPAQDPCGGHSLAHDFSFRFQLFEYKLFVGAELIQVEGERIDHSVYFVRVKSLVDVFVYVTGRLF